MEIFYSKKVKKYTKIPSVDDLRVWDCFFFFFLRERWGVFSGRLGVCFWKSKLQGQHMLEGIFQVNENET